MENTPSKTWNIARKLTNEEHEKCTLYDMEYGKKKKKPLKPWKMKNKPSNTRNMARKLNNEENKKRRLENLEHG